MSRAKLKIKLCTRVYHKQFVEDFQLVPVGACVVRFTVVSTIPSNCLSVASVTNCHRPRSVVVFQRMHKDKSILLVLPLSNAEKWGKNRPRKTVCLKKNEACAHPLLGAPPCNYQTEQGEST